MHWLLSDIGYRIKANFEVTEKKIQIHKKA